MTSRVSIMSDALLSANAFVAAGAFFSQQAGVFSQEEAERLFPASDVGPALFAAAASRAYPSAIPASD
jgi:hypothetical protein